MASLIQGVRQTKNLYPDLADHHHDFFCSMFFINHHTTIFVKMMLLPTSKNLYFSLRENIYI